MHEIYDRQGVPGGVCRFGLTTRRRDGLSISRLTKAEYFRAEPQAEACVSSKSPNIINDAGGQNISTETGNRRAGLMKRFHMGEH